MVEYLQGAPWRPFHHTLGISGFETHFDHPDHEFYALALALPHLSLATAAVTKSYLAAQLESSPPAEIEGFDRSVGQPRESYDVPPNLRRGGRGKARSAFGVYAFWFYVNRCGDSAAVEHRWARVRERMRELLEQPYPFDPRKADYEHDEAQKLNGDLAGVIALARLAVMNGDQNILPAATARVRELLELRVNLERVNPHIVEKTDASSKGLHHFKLARYCDLVPEVAAAIERLTDGCSAERVRHFRDVRPAWYLAFGDRLLGGENYTTSPDFSRALFAGASLIEHLSRAQIRSFVDVPWCRGDFYFMEKAALALEATADPRVAPKKDGAGAAPE